MNSEEIQWNGDILLLFKSEKDGGKKSARACNAWTNKYITKILYYNRNKQRMNSKETQIV